MIMGIEEWMIKDILTHYGIEKQSMVACEELAECIKEISKQLRVERCNSALVSEIADVYIMLEQIKAHYGIDDYSMHIEIKLKLDRTIKRMNGD